MRDDARVDAAALRDLFQGPGTDTRSWLSIGLVEPGDAAVEFDKTGGAPLVTVSLQPSGAPVRCRVLSFSAGDGEGDWKPFVAGDEVLVGLVGGSERHGVILGRLHNGRLPFPFDSVAGQDPTTNSFAFVRHRTAFVQEMAGPVVLRQATTGALLSIDASGVVTLRGGDAAVLQISPDLFGYQSSDGKHVLQIDVTGERFLLQVGDAQLSLGSSSSSPTANALVSPGPLSLLVSGNPAAEHVTTTEAVAGILTQLLIAIGTASPGPVIGAALAGAAPAIVTAALTLASQTPLLPPVAALLYGLFGAAIAKPPGVPGQGQLQPGLGVPGLLTG